MKKVTLFTASAALALFSIAYFSVTLAAAAAAPVDARPQSISEQQLIEKYQLPAKLKGLETTLNYFFMKPDVKSALIIPRDQMLVASTGSYYVPERRTSQISNLMCQYHHVQYTITDGKVLLTLSQFPDYSVEIPLLSYKAHPNAHQLGSCNYHLSPILYGYAVEKIAEEIKQPLQQQQVFLYHIPGQPEQLFSNDTINYLLIKQNVVTPTLSLTDNVSKNSKKKVASVCFRMVKDIAPTIRESIRSLPDMSQDEKNCLYEILNQYTLSLEQLNYLRSHERLMFGLTKEEMFIPEIVSCCNDLLYNLVTILVGAGYYYLPTKSLFFLDSSNILVDTDMLCTLLYEKPRFGESITDEFIAAQAQQQLFFYADSTSFQGAIQNTLKNLSKLIFDQQGISRSWYTRYHPELAS